MERPALDAPDAEWLVYADALQVAGDPRGELISLVHGADAKSIDTFVHKHADALLGPAAKSFRKNAYRLTWRHCFIDTADVRLTSDDHGDHWVRALLACPAAAELREIAITGVTDNERAVDLAPAISAVTAAQWPASCHSLALVDDRATRARTQISRVFNTDENLVQFGPLAAVWRVPQLAHLRLDLADSFSLDIGPVDGTKLRSLTVRTLRYASGWRNGEPSPFSDRFAYTTWPQLEEVELRLAETFTANVPLERKPYIAIYSTGDDEQLEARVAEGFDGPDDGDNLPTDYTELEPFLAELVDAPLRRLALTSFVSADSLLDTLARTGLPPTLRVLDLSDSALRRPHVDWMREHRALFASLTELHLERTSIDPSWLGELADLGPKIVHSHLRSAPTYRYVVGME